MVPNKSSFIQDTAHIYEYNPYFCISVYIALFRAAIKRDKSYLKNVLMEEKSVKSYSFLGKYSEKVAQILSANLEVPSD